MALVKYNLDPAHSSANFSIKHMMIAKVQGSFDKLKGSVEYDAANPAATKVEASIDASSINTREAQRDAHLKSADFFDIGKFPTLSFKSKKVEKGGEGLKITGDLTIHGVSKEVVLNVDGPSQEMKDPYGNLKIGAAATTKISRKEFGLTWNAALEAGGFLVGDDVTINLELQFTKQA